MRSLGLLRLVAVAAAFSFVGVGAAAEELRTWTDKSGKFKITAKFVSVEDGTVTLEKEDGKTIEIPLEKLSAADQKLVAEASASPFKEKEKNPFAEKGGAKNRKMERPGKRPPVRDLRNKKAAGGVDEVGWSAAKALELAPRSEGWKPEIGREPAVDLAGRAFAIPKRTDFFEKVSAMVMSGAAKRGVIGYSLNRDNKPTTRLVLLDLATGKGTEAGSVEGDWLPLSLADDGKRLLVRRAAWGFGNSEKLAIWTLADGEISTDAEWTAYGDLNGGDKDVKWAAFLNDDRIVSISANGKLAFWSGSPPRPESYLMVKGGSVPALSADRSRIVFLTDKEIGVLDAKTGETIALKPAPQNLAWPQLAISPGGTRIAAVAHNKIYVWDAANGEQIRDILLTNVGIGGAPMFTSENHLLLGGNALFDVERQIPLWTYMGAEQWAVLGGRAWFAISSGWEKPGAIVAAKLPHSAVQKALESALADPNFFIVKPGAEVAIDVNGITDPGERERAQAALAKRLEDNGVKIAANSPVKVTATTEAAKEKEIPYHTFGSFGTRNYKVKEFLCRVKVEYGGKTAWESVGSNIPHIVMSNREEKFEDALRRHEKPNYAFFQHLEFPKMLMAPTGKQTLGQSQISITGVR